jgi:hypothetical protein
MQPNPAWPPDIENDSSDLDITCAATSASGTMTRCAVARQTSFVHCGEKGVRLSLVNPLFHAKLHCH